MLLWLDWFALCLWWHFLWFETFEFYVIIINSSLIGCFILILINRQSIPLRNRALAHNHPLLERVDSNPNNSLLNIFINIAVKLLLFILSFLHIQSLMVIIAFDLPYILILASFAIFHWWSHSKTMSLWKSVWWSLWFYVHIAVFALLAFGHVWLLPFVFILVVFVVTSHGNVWDVGKSIVKSLVFDMLIIIWKRIVTEISCSFIILSVLLFHFRISHLLWFYSSSECLTLIQIYEPAHFSQTIWLFWKVSR